MSLTADGYWLALKLEKFGVALPGALCPSDFGRRLGCRAYLTTANNLTCHNRAYASDE
jgi:hypothetical protein